MKRDLTLDEVILITVYKRLQKLSWNRQHTADSLGVSTRGLRLYMTTLKELGYKIEQSQPATTNHTSFNYDEARLSEEISD